jgi:hypothetical protein
MTLVTAVTISSATAFPGRAAEVASPDGKHAVMWLEAAGSRPHRLLLKDADTGRRRELMTFERHVAVAWGPSSRAVAVTDWSGSNTADVIVFWIGDGIVRQRLRERLETVPDRRALDNGHRYLECVRWESADVLTVRLWGCGDGTPEGLDREYEVTFDRHLLIRRIKVHAARR